MDLVTNIVPGVSDHQPDRLSLSATVPRAALRFALGYLILPLWGGGVSMDDQAPPRVFRHNRAGQDIPSCAI
jgi:hypothetical protein